MAPRRRRSSEVVVPLEKPKPTLVVPKRAAITAAAALIVDKKIKRPEKSSKDSDWQAEVWKLYDLIGELHFGLRWKSQALGRLKLTAAKVGPDGPEPIALAAEDDAKKNDPTDVVAVQVLKEFAGGSKGQQEILKGAGIHIDAVGESYIVVYADGTVSAYAPSEVKESQGKWTCGDKVLTDDDLLMHPRVPHPADCKRVDAPSKSALPVLRELHGLNQQLLSGIDSRLAGAGLLVVPKSVSPPQQPQTDEDASATPEGGAEADPFLMALMDAMMTPIADRESAAAVVPLVVRIPDEATGKIQHISFAAPFDPELRSLRDEAIRRLALELDMPPEILLGTGDVNHWGQWAIDENAVKFNIVPLADVIATEVVDEWYRPAVADALGHGEDLTVANQYTIYVDASELEQRADLSTNALNLYNVGVITKEALVRESGFDPSKDATPDLQQDKAVQLAMDLASKAPSLFQAPGLPAIVEQIRAAISGNTANVPAPGDATTPAETPTVESAPVEDTRALPAPPTQGPAQLVASIAHGGGVQHHGVSDRGHAPS